MPDCHNHVGHVAKAFTAQKEVKFSLACVALCGLVLSLSEGGTVILSLVPSTIVHLFLPPGRKIF